MGLIPKTVWILMVLSAQPIEFNPGQPVSTWHAMESFDDPINCEIARRDGARGLALLNAMAGGNTGQIPEIELSCVKFSLADGTDKTTK